MASVLDRSMFQKKATERVARERLKKMGNIQDYAGSGMFGTGGTMEDTGFRYPQPLGYGVGQVDPGIPEALKQRSFSGSQIVQGGDYTNRDVPDLRAKFQGLRNDLLMKIREVQTSSDPNKFEIINELQSKLAKLDRERDKTIALADRVTYTAEDKYGNLPGGATPFYSTDVVGPMLPQNMDIFQSLSERAAQNNLKTVPPVPNPALTPPPSDMEVDARGQSTRTFMDGKPLTAAGIPAFKGMLENQAGPSGMEMEARKLPKDAQGVQKGPTGMEAEVLGRKGSITPADVAAGLNNPKPEVREKTAADFAKQFADMAPKYEGINKGLMLAQIGFAIAAGESPNAMSNIANGLLAGSNMMIKDKAAKDEFNRQIQLSAMEYGLEIAKEDRALGREIAKEDRALGREFTDYVASGEVTYRGKTYESGESIPVLHSDIISGRMPDGVVSESLSDAMRVRDTALRTALIEAEENKTLSAEQYRASIAEIDKAADAFSKARNTIPLIEASIIRNAKGEVNGLKPAFLKAVNQAASALQIKLEGLDSVEKYDSAMKTVAARMVQDILGEAGNNISNVDRALVDSIVGVAAGGYGNMFKDQGVLNDKLQEILQQAESKQQSALDTYNTLMEGLSGTYTPSGTPFRSEKAERVFNPEEQAPKFEYLIDESGKYIKRYLGGGE